MAATSSDSTSDQLVEKLRQLREGLSNRVIAAQAENERLSAEVAGLRKQLATAQRIADDANAKHPITQDDLDKVAAERDALKTKLDEATTTHAAEIAKFKKEIEDLRSDHSSLQAAVQAAVSELDDDLEDSNPASKTPPPKPKKKTSWLDKLAGGEPK